MTGNFFNSRSVALVGVIAINVPHDGTYFLLEKRGKIMDQPGKWCVPCGYLDWDETGADGIIREIYEECNLNIEALMNNYPTRDVVNCMDEPWRVKTDPSANRQNITLRYGLVMRLGNLPEVSNVNVGPEEVEEVKWVHECDLDDYEFAFNHRYVIAKFISKFQTQWLL